MSISNAFHEWADAFNFIKLISLNLMLYGLVFFCCPPLTVHHFGNNSKNILEAITDEANALNIIKFIAMHFPPVNVVWSYIQEYILLLTIPDRTSFQQ